jgi:2-iminoacetate synthase
MYDPKSMRADEFIDHQEALDTLAYADSRKHDEGLAHEILERARRREGLGHRDASVLLARACDGGNDAEIFDLAKQIKQEFYGNRIVLFAPLYISNHCVNGCVYCPYRRGNAHIPRVKLTQQEIARETAALQSMGHKRLAVEAGEHPLENPIEYIVESIGTIYGVRHKNGSIRRVNVNIAAASVEDYRKLRAAEIGTYILFQETYHRGGYAAMHPSGPKSDYAWHAEAMDRAMSAGIDDVGLGVLFGLDRYRYEFAALLMHAEHLEAAHGVGPHTISVPRIRAADGVDPASFGNAISDDTFLRIVACVRVAVPYTGIIVSTRESQECRERALDIGVSQISGGSKTSVGGYGPPTQGGTPKGASPTKSGNECATSGSEDMNIEERARIDRSEQTEQFEVSDRRPLDDIVHWLLTLGHIPSFCTACYREGRTGDRFMELCKAGKIQSCCHPNALLTLKEYLLDYASPETRALGDAMVESGLRGIRNEKARLRIEARLKRIESGERDIRV